MSEFTSGYSDADARNTNAEVLRYSIGLAENGAELRTSYDDNVRGRSFSESSKEAIVALTEAANAKLWLLGLDLADTNDERIAGYHKALQAIHGSDEFGTGRWHPTKQVETSWFSSYHRLLSGLNPSSDERLQLQPQADLVQKSLLGELAASSLVFTAGDEYTHHNTGYPRKAGRQITDPNSPLWGYGISIDDYPGKQFGVDGRGPNVTVWMPTGVVSDRSVLGLKQFEYKDNDTWRQTYEAGYVPDTIAVQHLRMGVPQSSSDQVDTRSGHVAEFLEAARTL